MALLSGIPAWSPQGLCAAWPKPTQPGREIFHSSSCWDTLLQAPSKKPTLDLFSPVPLCGQISCQRGGPGHGLLHTTAGAWSCHGPRSKGEHVFHCRWREKLGFVWKMNGWKDTAELETSPSLGRAWGYRVKKFQIVSCSLNAAEQHRVARGHCGCCLPVLCGPFLSMLCSS